MEHPNQPASKSASREVRVFVSSTFRDMETERDRLAKFVFPELRRRCRERGVEFVEVDLRWGVTEAQAERGEILPICLAEIDNCRPYFIGLLGERYGFLCRSTSTQNCNSASPGSPRTEATASGIRRPCRNALFRRLGLGSVRRLLVAGVVVGPYSPGPYVTAHVGGAGPLTARA